MSSDNILISFIIPSFNRAHSLPSAIESICRQSSSNWELIIVDDGSRDKTKDTVRPYLKDSRIKYFYQENSGVSVARNFGVKKSLGDFIIFLDSDDCFKENLLENLNIIGPSNYDLICWQVEREIDGRKFIQKPANLGKLYNEITAVFLAGSVCYKKSIFIGAGGYDKNMTFGENFELGLRLSENKDLKIKILDLPLLYYSIDTTNRTSNNIQNRLNSYLHQYEKHKDKYQRNFKANSLMNYLIGYTLEKINNKSAALQWYKNSWRTNPLNLKSMLKFLYLTVTR